MQPCQITLKLSWKKLNKRKKSKNLKMHRIRKSKNPKNWEKSSNQIIKSGLKSIVNLIKHKKCNMLYVWIQWVKIGNLLKMKDCLLLDVFKNSEIDGNKLNNKIYYQILSLKLRELVMTKDTQKNMKMLTIMSLPEL